ncbi:DUF4238 domain-containing protein [Nocardia nova]|uniref:DUF4238 domain-containing protein n=1 Tax=Nocardia nova TaxID=37330 RepID=UPI0033CAB9A1
MAKDHYIPAVLLGQFSVAEDLGRSSARTRRVWRANKQDSQVRQVPASSLGKVSGLYDHPDYTPDEKETTVDGSWSGYEDRIPELVRTVSEGRFPGLIETKIWMQVVLPLVAGLFVRGTDFSHGKMVVRFDEKGKRIRFGEKTVRNLSRIPEQIRLLAPLMAAEWEVIKFDGVDTVVTSDRGYTLLSEGDGIAGIGVPLTPRHILVARRREESVIGVGLGGEWYKPLRQVRGTDDMAKQISRSMARNAREFIIGPDSLQLKALREQLGKGLVPPSAPLHNIWGTDRDLRTNVMEWVIAFAELRRPPDDEVVLNFARKAEVRAQTSDIKGWVPPVFLWPVGQANGLTGVQRYGEVIKYDRTFRTRARDFYEFENMVIRMSAVPRATVFTPVSVSIEWHSPDDPDAEYFA